MTDFNFFLTGVLVVAAIIAAFFAGSLTTSRAYQEAARDRGDLWAERRDLIAENQRLNAELFELRRRVLELETRLNQALEEIARLSSTLSGPGDPGADL